MKVAFCLKGALERERGVTTSATLGSLQHRWPQGRSIAKQLEVWFFNNDLIVSTTKTDAFDNLAVKNKYLKLEINSAIFSTTLHSN